MVLLMAVQQIASHYSRILTRWPLDRLRPEERSFQNLVLKKRIESAPNTSGGQHERKDVNAAYLLLDNVFAKQYPLSDKMMKPASNPDHYIDLTKELEEAPNRTWFGNLMRRMQGIVRFQ